MLRFMEMHKKEIINALNNNAKELRQGIDMHCCLVSSVLEGKADEHLLQPLFNLSPKRPREIKLEKAVKEAIEIIEDSRKAFKSKRLEALRKKLTHVLIEAG